ncbi:MAG TPA: hypothetical protein VGF95_11840 [Solirubrobacteraceae bacterium]
MSTSTYTRAGATTVRLATLLAGISLALALAFGASPALAGEGRVTVGSPFGSFSHPTGIAVDQSNGNVYVADGGGHEEIQVFGPEGQTPLGGGPASFTGEDTPSGAFDLKSEPTGIAAAAGEVVVPDVQDNLVDEFHLDSGLEYEFLCQVTGYGASGDICVTSGSSGGTAFGEPLGVALDAAGDVYIGDYRSKSVYELSSAGGQIAAFAMPGGGAPQYLAVAADGTIYIQQYGSNAVYELERSSLTGVVEGEREIAGGGVSGIAVDRTSGELLLDFGSYVQELNAYGTVTATFGLGMLSGAGDLAVDDATEAVYVLNEGQVQRFGPLVLLPEVKTEAAEVNKTMVKLHASVNPEGVAVSSCQFEYGASPGALTETAVCEPASPGSGAAPVAVTAQLSGLSSLTTYYYRLAAGNANGVAQGEVLSFTTGSAVEGVITGAAEDVSSSGARLTGSLEPNGADAHYYFEYGLDGYEFTSPTPPGSNAGSATEAVAATTTLSGLESNTTYHYRLVASNAEGVSYGEDESFTTSPAPPVIVQAPSISNVTSTSVVVSSSINPEHSPTSCYVLYVAQAGYEPGAIEPYGGQRSASCTVGEGFAATAAVQFVGGLLPGTTYHYALSVTNAAGTVVSSDATFTTAPATLPLAATGEASAIAQNSASIAATIDPQGYATTYGFEITTSPGEYGPPTGLGTVGAGMGETSVSLSLTGLAPGTTYYYRVAASNVNGTVYGAEHQFTTGSFPSTFVTPPAPLPFVTVPTISFPKQAGSTVTKKKHKAKPKAKKRRARHHHKAG